MADTGEQRMSLIGEIFQQEFRSFYLVEPERASKVVGAARNLAQGVQFGDGKVVVVWMRVEEPRLEIFSGGMAELRALHETGLRSIDWR